MCPLLALGILAGIFPAYGFRPECIPLLLLALFLVFANLLDMIAVFSSLHSDSYREQGFVFSLTTAAVFAFTLWLTVYYGPPLDMDLSTEGVKTVFLRGEELHVRIYGPVEPETLESQDEPEAVSPKSQVSQVDLPGFTGQAVRPLLILLPPVAGSFTVTDEVCSALRGRGFTVLAFSRLNFDSPFFDRNGMPIRLFAPGLFRLGRALTRGLSNTFANAAGRELEEGRKQDVVFILDELSRNKDLQDLLEGTDRDTVFLAGYGAGGAALTVLAGQGDFVSRYPQIRGIFSIEAPLLSSLESDELPPDPPSAGPITSFFRRAEEWVAGLAPKKITRIGPLPRPVLPVMFILSDRVIQERTGRYETVLWTLSISRNAALLAAVPGAGPFDYSGSPRYYPILSALFSGSLSEEGTANRDWPDLTAALITNFSVLLLENETLAPEPGDPGPRTLIKTALAGNIHLEQGGVWHIPPGRTILQP